MGLLESLKEKMGIKTKPKYSEAPKIPYDYPSAVDQMTQYGFKYLKETDSMAYRKEKIGKELDDLMESYLKAENGKDDYSMKVAINGLYNLCQLEIIPYFRAIENEELLLRAKMFMFKYDINHNSPNAYPKLITYIRYLLAHFTKIDVSVPIPFVIQNVAPQQHGVNPRVPSSPNPLGGGQTNNEQQ